MFSFLKDSRANAESSHHCYISSRMFRINFKRLNWLSSGLLWRTFFLLSILITTSLIIWVFSINKAAIAPRAEQKAAEIASIIGLTQLAFINAAPALQEDLLKNINQTEQIKILPLEDNDTILPVMENAIVDEIEANIRAKLGTQTRFAGNINGLKGFWVSFAIEGDPYWLGVNINRIEHNSGNQWLGWAGVVLAIISMLGAIFISRLINQPLVRLTAAARAIAKGKIPEPLPELGPEEIRETNRSFNQMVADLNQVESDRALVLAGISHDLRTPLARMQLEVEMAHLPDDAREGMQSDLHQMDAIIGQFLDYARPTDNSNFTAIETSMLLIDCAQEASRIPGIQIKTQIDDNIFVLGNATDLKRVFNNLIENARRYGKLAPEEFTELDINCRIAGAYVMIKFSDHGPGVPEADIERLLRPFTRLDTARGQANGAGLGLAIVDRVIRRHAGKMRVRNRPQGGLEIEISIPKA